MEKVRVVLVHSLIGATPKQKANAESLGLRKIGNETIQPDNAATRGKIKKIAHLVAWTEA